MKFNKNALEIRDLIYFVLRQEKNNHQKNQHIMLLSKCIDWNENTPKSIKLKTKTWLQFSGRKSQETPSNFIIDTKKKRKKIQVFELRVQREFPAHTCLTRLANNYKQQLLISYDKKENSQVFNHFIATQWWNKLEIQFE